MWCSTCQQDVPGIAVKGDGNRICCARCSGMLAGEKGQGAVLRSAEEKAAAPKSDTTKSDPLKAEALKADAASSVSPEAERQETPQVESPAPVRRSPPVDDWELEADLAAVTRMMRSLRIDSASTSTPRPLSASPAATTSLPPLAAAAAQGERRTRRSRRTGLFTWPILMLGMMAFTCGGVLLGWSFVTGRGELWAYGMPAVLAGQGLLVLGLVLQLEGLWQNHRDTLDELDRELAELRHAASLLTASHSGPGQSFYAHMAEGASPHLLLADVKGQLDLIAMRLAEARRG